MKAVAVVFLVLLINIPAFSASFESVVDDLRVKLRKEKLNDAILTTALGKEPEPDLQVLEKLKNQPEDKSTFASYTGGMLSKWRVEQGRGLYQENKAMLNTLAQETGVPAGVMVALWGVESSYGRYKGDFEVIRALATLAWKSHRQDYFTKELIAAVRMVQERHIKVRDLKGSWAGALGQCQFMPSSYLAYAADGNGDGKADIWHTPPDVWASTANYLTKKGWQKNQPWGTAVRVKKVLPETLVFTPRGLSGVLPVSEWKKLGFKPAIQTGNARLFWPEREKPEAFLVYENFEVIMRWNKSSYFAYSVLTLADKIMKD